MTSERSNSGSRREGYRPARYIEQIQELREALALLESGFFSFGEPARYAPLVEQLRREDRYLVCADFAAYLATEARAAELYRDAIEWSRRALLNISGASRFSADDTIRQYAAGIWGLRPVAVDLGLAVRNS